MDVALRTSLFFAVLLALQPPSAGAAPRPPTTGYYVDSTGVRWEWQENRHGAILRNGRNRLYLGRSCDARSLRYGRGSWGWANGGVLVTFANHSIGFPRHDPPVRPVRCLL